MMLPRAQSLRGLVPLLALTAPVHSFLPVISSTGGCSSVTTSDIQTVHYSSSLNKPSNVDDDDFSVVKGYSRRQAFERIVGGCATGICIIVAPHVANAEVAAKVSVSSQAKVSLEAKTKPTPAAPLPEKISPKSSNKLDNPGDVKNCSDFDTYNEAKAWFDKYYDLYGDVAKLDKNNNLIPCEALPGAPKTK